MKWTTPVDLKKQVVRLWDRGVLLASLSDDEGFFPKRLSFKAPGSRELSENFTEVRAWITQLNTAANYYRIEWRSVNHRILGTNKIPAKIWLDTVEGALGFIDKRDQADRFLSLVALTRESQPGLLPWLHKRPLRALELVNDWTNLLHLVAWVKAHPRPSLYLRQIDLPGVHSKFIEEHRGVLAELLDFVLPEEAIDQRFTGVRGFCNRYGFRDKPLRVRFRVLDPELVLLTPQADQDITVSREAFGALDIPVKRVFITENEINFLAFPHVPEALVIFGAGYGFDNLADATWLLQKEICYWGDIDSHGFAILDQLRKIFPEVKSLLMDQQTLLAHKLFWGHDTQPETRNLSQLSHEEKKLYDQLRQNHWGDRIRLEQERVGFDYLFSVLKAL